MPPSQVEKPGDAVAAAAHGDGQVVAAREADRGDHVGRAGAPDDERGTAAVVRAVPDPARLRVPLVARGQDLPPHGLAQLLNRCFPEDRGDGLAHVLLPFVLACRGSGIRRAFARP